MCNQFVPEASWIKDVFHTLGSLLLHITYKEFCEILLDGHFTGCGKGYCICNMINREMGRLRNIEAICSVYGVKVLDSLAFVKCRKEISRLTTRFEVLSLDR